MDALQSIDEVSVSDSPEESDRDSENDTDNDSNCDVDFANDDSDFDSNADSSEYDSEIDDDSEPNTPARLLRINEKLIRKLRKSKKTDELMTAYIKSTIFSRLIHNGKGSIYAKSHVLLGEAYLEVKKYPEQCLLHCQKAREILCRDNANYERSPSEAVNQCVCLLHYHSARALAKQKKYSLAEKEVVKAEKFSSKWSKFSGPSQHDIESMEFKIVYLASKIFMCMSNVTLAETYLLRTKDLIETTDVSNDVELVSILQYLGMVELKKKKKGDIGNEDKAIDYFTEAHTIAMENEGNNPLLSASTAHSLGNGYSCIEESAAQDSAESYLTQAMEIYKLHVGNCHEKWLNCVNDLIRVFCVSSRHQSAIDLLVTSMRARAAVYGQASKHLGHWYKVLSSLYQVVGDPVRSIKALRKSYSLVVMRIGSNHEIAKKIKADLEQLEGNPQVSSKFKKEKTIDDRPRFNSIVNRNT